MIDILVGIDGTEAGDAALRWALAEAAVTSGDVTAVHAWQLRSFVEPGGVFPFMTDAADAEHAAHQVLEASVARAMQRSPVTAGRRDLGPARVAPRLVPGPAAQALEHEAREARLLVLGRREGTAAPFGSVISAALHHVACPVVVVPSGYDAAGAAGRVIVGVAVGEASDGALRWAAAEAEMRGTALVPVLVRPAAHGPLLGADWPDAVALDQSALADLARHAAIDGPRPTAVEPEVLVGEAGSELVRFATAQDVLVVGSRGRGQLAGWLLGSTSNHVARHAPCPVVVVRDAD